MRLVTGQLARFRESGYVVTPPVLPDAAVDRLLRELPNLRHRAYQVREPDGATLRALYGSHLCHELFAQLCRHPSLLEPAQQILGGDVYVYQTKIYFRGIAEGDMSRWRQDLVSWQLKDGLPSGEIVNVALLLDDMTAANGAIEVIPGSHKRAVIDTFFDKDTLPEFFRDEPTWMDGLAADVDYDIEPDDEPAVTVTGRRGALLVFHPNLLHSSPRSTAPRRVLFITYCRTDNLPLPAGEPRHEFLVGRDFRPVVSCFDPRFEE
jgi:ectoine hydroxylase